VELEDSVDFEGTHTSDDGEGDEVFNFDFRRYLDALRKYLWAFLALIALAITGSVVYTERQPKVYEAKASVQIEPKLPDLLGQGQEIFAGTGVGATSDYYKQQMSVLGSYKLIRQSVDTHQLYLKLLSDQEREDKKVDEQIEEGTRRLQLMLSVKYPDQNRIMYVDVRSDNAQLAADLANAHIDTYIAYSKGLLSSDTGSAVDVLNAEFEDSEKKLRDAEAALYQFQKDNDLLAVSMEDRQSLMSQNIVAYTLKVNEERAKRIEIMARLERMKQANPEDALSSPILLMGDMTSFETLRAQYYAERNKFIEIEKELGPKHNEYQMQKAKMEDLLDALRSEAKRMVLSLEEQSKAALATEKGLQAEVDKATKDALEMGPKIVAYNELVRKKKSIDDRYTIVRQRLSTSELTDRMSGKFDATNVRPLDPALVPTEPVSPSMKINVLVAAVVAVVLGFGLIFLIVFLDRSIKSTSDAQQAAGAPVLGVIPRVPDGEVEDDRGRDRYVHDKPKSPVAESCRALRTNILFTGADRQLKTIVVSSAHPREGKTTCVVYLGTTMAQSGQRVLLIDTDMRRPRLHHLIGAPNQEGLSNLIIGSANYDDVIKPTDIDNLSVLPCGPLPPNPAELLMTNKFANVLTELGKRFDRIILDSPPCVPVTDAVVLSKKVDGVILVAQSGRTLRDDIKRASRQIRSVGGVMVGVILNAMDMNEKGYYGYYGGYYNYEARETTST
jgi:succinoglycan biosynthesis transport protein ExoP